MFGGAGEICVRSRAEAVDEVSFQDWKYAQERRGTSESVILFSI